MRWHPAPLWLLWESVGHLHVELNKTCPECRWKSQKQFQSPFLKEGDQTSWVRDCEQILYPKHGQIPRQKRRHMCLPCPFLRYNCAKRQSNLWVLAEKKNNKEVVLLCFLYCCGKAFLEVSFIMQILFKYLQAILQKLERNFSLAPTIKGTKEDHIFVFVFFFSATAHKFNIQFRAILSEVVR